VDTYIWVGTDYFLNRSLEDIAFSKNVKSDTLETPGGTVGSNQFIKPFFAPATDDDGGLRREIQNCKGEGTTYPCSRSDDEDALGFCNVRHDDGRGTRK